jgi:hypothetical protein
MFLKRNNFLIKMYLKRYSFAAPSLLHSLLYFKKPFIPGSKRMKPGMKGGWGWAIGIVSTD